MLSMKPTIAPIKTYRDMRDALESMSDEQLNSNITIEIDFSNEQFPAEMRDSNGNLVICLTENE